MKLFNTWKDESSSVREHPLQFGSIWLLALAAKRVALARSQTMTSLDVSTAFLHAEMKDEVYVKPDAVTLQLVREEKFPNLQTGDCGGFWRVDESAMPECAESCRAAVRMLGEVISFASVATVEIRQVDRAMAGVDVVQNLKTEKHAVGTKCV